MARRVNGIQIAGIPWAPSIESKDERVIVTPEVAGYMLAYNGRNRPISDTKIKRLSAKMAAGQWIFTHQGLGFSNEGVLIDGQHRLSAIMTSGVTCEFIVTYGLDPLTFDHVDTEGGRSASDLLAIRCPRIKHRAALCSMGRSMLVGMGGYDTTPPDVAEFVEWYQTLMVPIYQELKCQESWARVGPILGAFGNAARPDDEWHGGHGNRDLDTILLIAMRYGQCEWQGKGDPLHALFNRVTRARAQVGQKMDPMDLYRLATAAVRNELQGKKTGNLQKTDVEWGDKRDHGRRRRKPQKVGGVACK
jgi:hypothetical protein